MVSAIKKDGVALYKLARKGIEIERETRLFIFTDSISPILKPLHGRSD